MSGFLVASMTPETNYVVTTQIESDDDDNEPDAWLAREPEGSTSQVSRVSRRESVPKSEFPSISPPESAHIIRGSTHNALSPVTPRRDLPIATSPPSSDDDLNVSRISIARQNYDAPEPTPLLAGTPEGDPRELVTRETTVDEKSTGEPERQEKDSSNSGAKPPDDPKPADDPTVEPRNVSQCCLLL